MMKRALLSLALAVALAVTGTLAFNALSGSEQSAAFAKASTKTCKAKTSSGKTKTWQCRKDQACCVNKMMDLYVCGYPGLGCL